MEEPFLLQLPVPGSPQPQAQGNKAADPSQLPCCTVLGCQALPGHPSSGNPPGQHLLPLAHLCQKHRGHLLRQLSGLRHRHFPKLPGGF